MWKSAKITKFSENYLDYLCFICTEIDKKQKRIPLIDERIAHLNVWQGDWTRVNGPHYVLGARGLGEGTLIADPYPHDISGVGKITYVSRVLKQAEEENISVNDKNLRSKQKKVHFEIACPFTIEYRSFCIIILLIFFKYILVVWRWSRALLSKWKFETCLLGLRASA